MLLSNVYFHINTYVMVMKRFAGCLIQLRIILKGEGRICWLCKYWCVQNTLHKCCTTFHDDKVTPLLYIWHFHLTKLSTDMGPKIVAGLPCDTVRGEAASVASALSVFTVSSEQVWSAVMGTVAVTLWTLHWSSPHIVTLGTGQQRGGSVLHLRHHDLADLQTSGQSDKVCTDMCDTRADCDTCPHCD